VPNWDAKLINYKEHAAFFKECFENKAFELKRIFRASEHDFSIAKFHELCDNKGPTLFVGKSEQYEKHLEVLYLLTGTKIEEAIMRQILQLFYFS
jgi:hypothetical protein